MISDSLEENNDNDEEENKLALRKGPIFQFHKCI